MLGWHVAPVLPAHKIRVESSGGDTLLLPTLKIDEVTEVVRVPSGEPVAGGWFLSTLADPALQVLRRNSGCWPTGFVDVTLSHGYAVTPEALLWALDGICRLVTADPTVDSVRIDDYSKRYRSAATKIPSVASAVATYGLPPVA